MSEIAIKPDQGKGETIQVNARIVDCSKLIKDTHELQKDKKEAIPVKTPTETFKKVLNYLEAHKYKPTSVEKPIKTDKLELNLDEIDYRFIASYDLESVKEVLDAATELQIETLKDLCIARIATEFYIGNSLDDVLKLEMKFGRIKDLTQEDEDNLVRDYPWAKSSQKGGISADLISKDIMTSE